MGSRQRREGVTQEFSIPEKSAPHEKYQYIAYLCCQFIPIDLARMKIPGASGIGPTHSCHVLWDIINMNFVGRNRDLLCFLLSVVVKNCLKRFYCFRKQFCKYVKLYFVFVIRNVRRICIVS